MLVETKQDSRSVPVEARCVRLLAKAETPASLAPVIAQQPLSQAEIRDRIILRPSL
jgi:hypothetical protein